MAYIQQHGAELVTNLAHGKLFNPGYPSCRCAVTYEEIEHTNLNPDTTGDLESEIQVEPPRSAPTPDSAIDSAENTNLTPEQLKDIIKL